MTILCIQKLWNELHTTWMTISAHSKTSTLAWIHQIGCHILIIKISYLYPEAISHTKHKTYPAVREKYEQSRAAQTALLNNLQIIHLILLCCNDKIIPTLPKKIFNAFINVCHPFLLLSWCGCIYCKWFRCRSDQPPISKLWKNGQGFVGDNRREIFKLRAVRLDTIKTTYARHLPKTQVSPLPVELCVAYYTEKRIHPSNPL